MPDRHVTLTGDQAGSYLIEQELSEGRLLLRPDPNPPASTPSFPGRPATTSEFQDLLGGLPADDEG